MTPNEFLTRVLPEGLVVIAELAGRGFKHHVYNNFLEAAAKAQAIDASGRDCYFGLASLKEERVWNPDWKNKAGVVEGRWEVRVQRNIAELKSLFIDLDVDPTDPRKYASQAEALGATIDFCKATSFPKPLVVNSGGGIHLYWPFVRSVPVDQWRAVAKSFKLSLQKYGFKFDPSRTADASSVLRVVGTHNYKAGQKREVSLLNDVAPYSLKGILTCVTHLAEMCGTAAPTPEAPKTAFDTLGTNLGKDFAPADFAPIAEKCAQIAAVIADGGDSSGQSAWYHALSVTRLCEDAETASLIVSSSYPDFDRSAVQGMDAKLAQLAAGDYGPAKCETFDNSCPGICGTCEHWGDISSPIVLGRKSGPVIDDTPLEIETVDTVTGEVVTQEIPNPPFPFHRKAGGGIVVSQDAKGNGGDEAEMVTIYEHDIYPVRRLVNERHDTEQTIWRARLPIVGWVEVEVSQAQLAESTGLHGLLMSKGIYIHPARIKLMVNFMVAYITQLQKETRTEQLFSRLGWRDDHKLFVLDDKIYRHDGRVETHRISTELKNEVQGLGRDGTLEGWKDAIQFYNAPDHEAYRFFLYGAFGAPLFHMTGLHSAIVNASGPTGIGKTTVLNAIGSVWGHPQQIVVNGTKGGTTANALQSLLSIYNNLPFCLDEVTLIDKKAFAEFVMTATQGTGKRRAARNGSLQRHVETWSTPIYTSANTDLYVTLMQNRRDASAEAMRVLQIPFSMPSTYTKTQADEFYRGKLLNNYGHAAHEFVPYITGKYAAIKDTLLKVVNTTDAKAHVSAAERFYSGTIAAHIVGAMVARKLDLLPDFPVERDWEWAIDQISVTRTNMADHFSSAAEILSEFLESRVSETLSIAQTLQANIAPRLDHIPRGALSIRHEVDVGLVFVMKTEFKRYCVETGANYGAIQEELTGLGILLDHDAKKVLGAGTDFGKGQVRCWVIDVKALQQ